MWSCRRRWFFLAVAARNDGEGGTDGGWSYGFVRVGFWVLFAQGSMRAVGSIGWPWTRARSSLPLACAPSTATRRHGKAPRGANYYGTLNPPQVVITPIGQFGFPSILYSFRVVVLFLWKFMASKTTNKIKSRDRTIEDYYYVW